MSRIQFLLAFRRNQATMPKTVKCFFGEHLIQRKQCYHGNGQSTNNRIKQTTTKKKKLSCQPLAVFLPHQNSHMLRLPLLNHV